MLNKFKIGHYTDAQNGTGCSVIICEEGAIGGVSVLGGAPGSRETDLLRSENSVDNVYAVVLSGGSAFGLESADGVMRFLHSKGVGFNTGKYSVPIVPAAVLFDLEYGNFCYPDVAAGFAAAEDARVDNFACGSIGAGTGATVGKILGMASCEKSGLGIYSTKIGNLEVGAMVAVNALGDVYNPENGAILAGATLPNGSYLNTVQAVQQSIAEPPLGKNTTIGVVFTNAKLTKSQANKLATAVHDAYSLCIRPVHSNFDGDAIFVMGAGDVEVNQLTLQVVATQCMCKAITGIFTNKQ